MVHGLEVCVYLNHIGYTHIYYIIKSPHGVFIFGYDFFSMGLSEVLSEDLCVCVCIFIVK